MRTQGRVCRTKSSSARPCCRPRACSLVPPHLTTHPCIHVSTHRVCPHSLPTLTFLAVSPPCALHLLSTHLSICSRSTLRYVYVYCPLLDRVSVKSHQLRQASSPVHGDAVRSVYRGADPVEHHLDVLLMSVCEMLLAFTEGMPHAHA